LYKSKYKVETLQRISDEIENSKLTKEAFIYFNNDIDGSAITNAFEMEAYIERLAKKDFGAIEKRS
jgi:uncharacterized protein YecE (DUF72 family)